MSDKGSASTALGWTAAGLTVLAVIWPGHLRGSFVGDGVDVYGTFWFYGWVEFCVTHLRDPTFTDWMFHPFGKDIFAHTGGNIVDALLSVPFQWVFGTPEYQPVFIASVLLANAAAFMRLQRSIGVQGAAAWGSTLVWMVNPFVMFELLTGRITQALLVFLPLAVLHFLRSGEGTRRDAVWAGLFTAAQAYTYWFMGLFMAVLYAGIAVWQWRCSKRPFRALAQAWGVAAACCLVAIAPALFRMASAASANNVPGLGAGAGWQGFIDAMSGGTMPHLHGLLLSEQNGVHFLGYAFWGALTLVVMTHPRTRGVWGVMAAVAIAFSLGPEIDLGEGRQMAMPHYLLGVHMVPFMERLWFPYRWIAIAMFAVSVGLGVILMEFRLPRMRLLVAAAAVALALEPQVRSGVLPLARNDWTMPSVYSHIKREQGGIIELPMMVPRRSLMYQPIHRQVLFGGMGENAPVFWTRAFKHRMGNHFVRALRSAVSSETGLASFSPQDREKIERDGMRWIVLDREAAMSVVAKTAWFKAKPELRRGAAGRAVERLTAIVGPPVAVEGSLVIWDLEGGAPFQGDLAPSGENLSGEGWTGVDWELYETRLIERLQKEGALR